MFKQRLLTSMVLIPLVLGLLYWGNAWVLSGALLVILAGLGWEYTQLIPLSQTAGRLGYVIVLLGLSIVVYALALPEAILWMTLVIWGVLAIAIWTYPRSQRFWGRPWVLFGLGVGLLPLFVVTLAKLYQTAQGPWLLLYLLLLVWATDIGAYLVGKQWGRHKLIPHVSPGKTIEGLIGGVVLAGVIAEVGLVYFQPNQASRWYLVALGTVFISIIGDLLISMLKRRCHLKDTGQLLPGHGGLLDRLDSLIAAVPFFYWSVLSLLNTHLQGH